MADVMHRVYCAAASDLEEERQAFLSVIGEFNETEGIKRGVLFVPVLLLWPVQDKRLIQGTVDQNIRACRYYVQVLKETW
ncbi:MAG TPA: hypothetical protein VGH38_08520, partial [Bryobacteraceae bacterium]